MSLEPPKPKASLGRRAFFWIAGIAIGIKACLACNAVVNPGAERSQQASQATQTAPVEPAVVRISQVLSEYKDNELRADAEFRGKLIETRGMVKTVARDITNSIYVELGTREGIEYPALQCFFPAGHESEVTGLSRGTIIRFRGVVTGKMMNVLADHCQVLNTEQ